MAYSIACSTPPCSYTKLKISEAMEVFTTRDSHTWWWVHEKELPESHVEYRFASTCSAYRGDGVTQSVYCWCMMTFWRILRNFLFVTQLFYSINATSLENQGLTRFVSFGFVVNLHSLTFVAAEVNGIIENLPFFQARYPVSHLST